MGSRARLAVLVALVSVAGCRSEPECELSLDGPSLLEPLAPAPQVERVCAGEMCFEVSIHGVVSQTQRPVVWPGFVALSESLAVELYRFDLESQLILQTRAELGSARAVHVDVDGRRGLLVGGHTLCGDKTYLFENPVNWEGAPELGREFVPLASGDFDQDGYTDVVSFDGVEWGGAEAPFQETTPFYIDLMAHAGDVDGDGRMDVIAGSSHSTEVHLSRPGRSFETVEGPPHGVVAVADLDGDAVWDLVVEEQDVYGKVARDYHHVNGEFQQGQLELRMRINALAAADFDADGVPELIVAGQGMVLVRPYDSWESALLEGLTPARWITVGDVDGDGDPDFVSSGTSNNPWDNPVVVYRNVTGEL